MVGNLPQYPSNAIGLFVIILLSQGVCFNLWQAYVWLIETFHTITSIYFCYTLELLLHVKRISRSMMNIINWVTPSFRLLSNAIWLRSYPILSTLLQLIWLVIVYSTWVILSLIVRTVINDKFYYVFV